MKKLFFVIALLMSAVVYADLAIRAYESSPASSKMTLLPGYVHQDAVKMMTDEDILQLDEDFVAVK